VEVRDRDLEGSAAELVAVKASLGGQGLDQGRGLEVRDQHEDIHVHGEPRRAV